MSSLKRNQSPIGLFQIPHRSPADLYRNLASLSPSLYRDQLVALGKYLRKEGEMAPFDPSISCGVCGARYNGIRYSSCPYCGRLVTTGPVTTGRIATRTYSSRTFSFDDPIPEPKPGLPIIHSPIPILAQRGISLAYAGKDGMPTEHGKVLKDQFYLTSINQGRIITHFEIARCNRLGVRLPSEVLHHLSPDPDCQCGFYAVPYKGDDTDDRAIVSGSGYVTAHVELSGRVLECGNKETGITPAWVERNMTALWDWYLSYHRQTYVPPNWAIDGGDHNTIQFLIRVLQNRIVEENTPIPQGLGNFVPPDAMAAIAETKVTIMGYRAQVQRVLSVDIRVATLFSKFPRMVLGWKNGKVSGTMHKMADDNPHIAFNLLVPRKDEKVYACRTYRAGSPSEVGDDKPFA